MNKIIVSILSTLITYAGLCQNQPFIRTWQVTRPGIKDPDEVTQLAPSDGQQLTNYIDGFGRQLQTVIKAATPAKKDVIQPYSFDEFGRPAKQYLPFIGTTNTGSFSANGLAAQQSFYNGLFPGDGRFYQETLYDQTGLNRVIGQQRPGNAWEANGKKETYTVGFGGNKQIWTIGTDANALPVSSGNAVYPPETLVISSISNEESGTKVSYTDFKGNVVLEQVKTIANGPSPDEHSGTLSTYYVYDDFNRLRFIITPKAVEWLATHGWQITQSIADELCYIYNYDNLGRVISKKQPGAGSVEIVYDRRHRVVFTRNATDKANNRWIAALYDQLDRLKVSGYIKTEQELNRTELQGYVSAQDIQASIISAQIANNAGMIKNLSIDSRELGRDLYQAAHEITFGSGFESENNAEFTAEIISLDPQPISREIVVMGNPVPITAQLITLAVQYYDDYNFETAQSFSNSFQFPANSNPNTVPLVKGYRTLDKPTGSLTRVVEGEASQTTGSFLSSTYHYDEQDNLLQTIQENYLKGTDIVTTQYEYGGIVTGTCLVQNLPGTSISNFRTNTLYEHDAHGRTMSISKSYGGQPYHNLVRYVYDELGRVKTQILAPDYDGGQGIETLQYNYNLQGLLEGINAPFVSTSNRSEQWNHYFGEILGYENSNNLFAKARYDGKLTGASWKSQGDNISRKYDYDYALAGFLTKADFTQNETLGSTGWNSTLMDASASEIAYDANGNMLSMRQKGLIPGNTTPSLIDDLTYQYENNNNSNRLKAVNDAVSGSANGVSGDFKNAVNAPMQQYIYDQAGNLTTDINKGMQSGNTQGISYNVLDKPAKVIIDGKYELNYVYDASGNLLAKQIVKTDVLPHAEKWQYYSNGLVLYDQSPQYFVNEAGRLRVSQTVSSPVNTIPSLQLGGNNGLVIDGRPAFFDYYISDHQGSTRAVLTEEEHVEDHLATMEITDAPRKDYEEKMFGKVDQMGQPDGGNEIRLTRENIPAGWNSHYSDPTNQKASRLNQTQPVGPNALLKVMAGDLVNLHTDYYFSETPGSNDNGQTSIANALLNAFVSSIPAVQAGAKDVAAQLQSQFSNPGGILASYLNSPDNTGGNTGLPRAYLNWIFFDESFNIVPYDAATGLGSGAKRVTDAGDVPGLTELAIKAPRNGYLFVYVSNTSNTSVWFDNLMIRHTRSRLMQEHHYYPYGLEIAAISSKSHGKLDDYFKYQGAFSEFEEETGWNNFDLRSYDPQLGRWNGIDPYDEFSSGYMGMGGDPANNVDPDGGFTSGGWGAGIGAPLGFAVAYLIAKNNDFNTGLALLAGLGGGILGSGMGYSILESISPMAVGHNQSHSVWENFKAFYEGVVGMNSQSFRLDRQGNGVWRPSIWGERAEEAPFQTIRGRIVHTGTALPPLGTINIPIRPLVNTPGPPPVVNQLPPPRARTFVLNSRLNAELGFAGWSGALSVQELEFVDDVVAQARQAVAGGANFTNLNVTMSTTLSTSVLGNVITGGAELVNNRGIRIDGGTSSSNFRNIRNMNTSLVNLQNQAANIANLIRRRLGIPARNVRVNFQPATRQNKVSVRLLGIQTSPTPSTP